MEMKKLLFLILIFALTACGAAPTAAPPAAAQPPVVITVVVPATSAPAAAPTDVPPTAVPPTVAPVATEAPAATQTTAPVVVENTPTATLPPAVGADKLVNITRDGDHFSLKCSPSQIVFTGTAGDTYVTGAEIWYRMVEKVTGLESKWYAGGKMDSDGKGNFTRTFSALDVNPDVRFDNAWFEYQFIVLAKDGNVYWRSDKTTYAKQVTFTKECP
jgi:hypothetical protein